MLLVLDTMLTAVEPDVRETVNVTACYTASILQPLERDAEFEFVLISENSTATLSLDFFVPELDRPVLVIPSGEAGEYFRCINVTIIGDDEVEGDEVAVYELVPVDDRDAVLFPSDTMEIVITIIDNDNSMYSDTSLIWVPLIMATARGCLYLRFVYRYLRIHLL